MTKQKREKVTTKPREQEAQGAKPEEDVTLWPRILDQQEQFFGEPVDIDIKQRAQESEPRGVVKRIPASEEIRIAGLRRFPQSDYVAAVTPSEGFNSRSQFGAIHASGSAQFIKR